MIIFGAFLQQSSKISLEHFWCICLASAGFKKLAVERVIVAVFVLCFVLFWWHLIYLLQLASGCDASVLKDLLTPDGYKFLCQVSSDADGRFVFGSVPCGQYLLVRCTVLCCLKCEFGSPETICGLRAPATQSGSPITWSWSHYGSEGLCDSIGGPYYSIVVPLWVWRPLQFNRDPYHSIVVPLQLVHEAL